MTTAESSYWRDRPVLVTGASGFLGGWLVRRLHEAGADLVALVRDWVPDSLLLSSKLMSHVRVVRGDIRNQSLMERVLGEQEIHTVFHLAAQTVVGPGHRNAVSTFDSNIRGTWSVLEAARRSPLVRSVVIASSDKAYGASPVLPYDENTPLRPTHPYDVSKACADMIARSYALTFDLPVAITRCGNFYGGGDLNWNRLVPGTIRSVIRGVAPVIRSDGSLVRDYFYVEDAAAAYILLAEALATKPELRGEAFNFSSELNLSVLELTQRILRAMNSDLVPTVLSDAPFEIREQALSAAKARAQLGWAPRYSLDEGVKKTVAWYREFLSRE